MDDFEVVTTARELDQPAPRPWSADQEESLRLWIALARCYSSFAKAVSCKIQEYGLTTPQFGVLEALFHLGPLSLGELAEKLLVTGGNVTYVMDRLEQRGLVYRDRSEGDRRVIQAKLTTAGREMISSVFPGHVEYVEHLTRHLEPNERRELRSLLKKLGRGIAEEEL
ncbi:MAG: MarR family transcriptional regulator [Gemmatimonadota bacterium]|nr:MarR family transcriptional regulator [Gemmatimonadota bacterium]